MPVGTGTSKDVVAPTQKSFGPRVLPSEHVPKASFAIAASLSTDFRGTGGSVGPKPRTPTAALLRSPATGGGGAPRPGLAGFRYPTVAFRQMTTGFPVECAFRGSMLRKMVAGPVGAGPLPKPPRPPPLLNRNL